MRRKGFTLVELLVVIGIIAVLIGVLLPALQSAKRSANAVKCSAAMREIGNCFQFYSQENKGFYPPARTFGDNYRISYGTGTSGLDYTAAQYWANFLAKYVTKTKVGINNTSGQSSADQSAQARNSIFWGCPSWEPPSTTSSLTGLGGISVVQSGYGMNAFPEYTADYPTPAAPPNVLGDGGFSPSLDTIAVATPSDKTGTNWATIPTTVADGQTGGKWYKQKAWTRPAERCLVADGRFWLIEAQAAPLDGTFPGQGVVTIGSTWATPNTDGQTTFDWYRHGKYPPTLSGGSTGRFSPTGGKIGFNVMFADGHVSTLNDRAEGYKAARMRYPG